MNVEFNLDKIRRLFIDFYTLSGLRLALYNADYQLLFDYPAENRPICSLIQHTPSGKALCRLSEHRGMEQAEHSKEGYSLYCCHAGLIDVCFTVKYEHETVAYFFFGSLISDQSVSRGAILENCAPLISEIAVWEEAIMHMPYTPISYIHSAIHVMRACINNILYENMIKIQGDVIWEKIDNYVNDNISRKFSLTDMSRDIFVSTSTISHRTKSATGQSIGNYILRRKMDRASDYLRHTDYKINQVADMIGIGDYNYFSRLFKKTFGISPTQFRDEHRRAGMN